MAAETIYATFPSVGDAERAIGALIDRGIARNNIGVIARLPAEQDEAERVRGGYTRVSEPAEAGLGEGVAAYEPRPQTLPPAAIADTVTPVDSIDTPDNVETVGKEGVTTTTAADAAAGAAVGTGIGLVAGLLAGAASLVVPGFGMVLAAGAVASAIGATVATTAAGAIAGGAIGYLRDLGMDDVAASSYAERLSQGDYIIAVTIDSTDYDNVRRLLMKYNAAGVDTEVTAAGETVRRAWANDPALVSYMENPPVQIGSPTPVRRIMTEDPNGRPIIPAQEVDAGGSDWSRLPDETPATSEAALETREAAEDELQNR